MYVLRLQLLQQARFLVSEIQNSVQFKMQWLAKTLERLYVACIVRNILKFQWMRNETRLSQSYW